MNDENRKPHINQIKWGLDALVPIIRAFPQIIKPEMGTEAFVEDLNKAAKKFALYFFDEEND